ncbi:MAG: hypothetical protein KDD82_29575 [Planctomycetes bacterium]|nr:hypothetical protein [Planctomycetota bacterium]
MLRSSIASLVSLALVAAAPFAAAEEPQQAWMILAQRPLPVAEQSVQLPLNGLKGSFDHLRLGVAGAEAALGSLTVHFGNGETHAVELGQTLAAGDFCAPIELPTKLQRTMVRLDLDYVAQPGAQVRVYGAADRWVTLGRDTVGTAGETHTIEVGVGESRYDRVRLSVEESALHLQGVTFHFTSGEPQEIKFFGIQGKDSLTRVADLTGGARVIARVELRYKALNPAAPAPVVSVFAHTASKLEQGGAADDQVWQTLGQGWATLAKGEVVIRGLALRGMVNTQLKVQVEGKALQVTELEIVFGNEEHQTVALSGTLEPGQACAPIELEGTTKRTVARIKLSYAPQKALGRAKVIVLGQ